jgi:putative ABC transport system permease protein
MKPVLTGMAMGLVSAAASARLIQSLLCEVRDLDPFVFAAPPVLVVIAALARYTPASRSSRIDPAVALRHD